MNPNDAVATDPQQRKLMEVSFEALQNGESLPEPTVAFIT